MNGTPFLLPDKKGQGNDSVEPLGQSIALPMVAACSGVAFLACGEMGDQWLDVCLCGTDRYESGVRIPAAMIEHEGRSVGSALVFTHVHYAAGYEQDSRLAALWACHMPVSRPAAFTTLILGTNPLVHIAAITLIR